MIFVFFVIESREMMTFIHSNLGVALALLCVTFLCIEHARMHSVTCLLEMIFLYYFSMSALIWMLIEGINNVQYLKSHRKPTGRFSEFEF